MPSETDPNFGWTVQDTSRTWWTNNDPGQVFTADQLPNPKDQMLGGVSPRLWINNGSLPVVASLDPVAPTVEITGAETQAGQFNALLDVTVTGFPDPHATYDWGDGSPPDYSTGAPYGAGHVYAAVGSYPATVTVYNSAGNDIDTLTVQIIPAPTPPAVPTISDVDPETGSTEGGEEITITGSGFMEVNS